MTVPPAAVIEHHGEYFLKHHAFQPDLKFTVEAYPSTPPFVAIWLHARGEPPSSGVYKVIGTEKIYDNYCLSIASWALLMDVFRELFHTYQDHGPLKLSLLAAEEYEEIIALQDAAKNDNLA
jgi:hypothetical protein